MEYCRAEVQFFWVLFAAGPPPPARADHTAVMWRYCDCGHWKVIYRSQNHLLPQSSKTKVARRRALPSIQLALQAFFSLNPAAGRGASLVMF